MSGTKEGKYIELRNQIYEQEKKRKELNFDNENTYENIKKKVNESKSNFDSEFNFDILNNNTELNDLQEELNNLFNKIQEYTPEDDFQERKKDIDDFKEKNNDFEEKYTNFIDEVYANFVKEKKEEERKNNQENLQKNLTTVITNMIKDKLDAEKLRIMKENIKKAEDDEEERRLGEEALKQEEQRQQKEKFVINKNEHIGKLNDLIERYIDIIKKCQYIGESIDDKNKVIDTYKENLIYKFFEEKELNKDINAFFNKSKGEFQSYSDSNDNIKKDANEINTELQNMKTQIDNLEIDFNNDGEEDIQKKYNQINDQNLDKQGALQEEYKKTLDNITEKLNEFIVSFTREKDKVEKDYEEENRKKKKQLILSAQETASAKSINQEIGMRQKTKDILKKQLEKRKELNKSNKLKETVIKLVLKNLEDRLKGPSPNNANTNEERIVREKENPETDSDDDTVLTDNEDYVQAAKDDILPPIIDLIKGKIDGSSGDGSSGVVSSVDGSSVDGKSGVVSSGVVSSGVVSSVDGETVDGERDDESEYEKDSKKILADCQNILKNYKSGEYYDFAYAYHSHGNTFCVCKRKEPEKEQEKKEETVQQGGFSKDELNPHAPIIFLKYDSNTGKVMNVDINEAKMDFTEHKYVPKPIEVSSESSESRKSETETSEERSDKMEISADSKSKPNGFFSGFFKNKDKSKGNSFLSLFGISNDSSQGVSTKSDSSQGEPSVDNSSKSDSSKTQNKNEEIKQKILEAIVSNIKTRIFNEPYEFGSPGSESSQNFTESESDSESDSGSDSEPDSNKGVDNSSDLPGDVESQNFSYDTDNTSMTSNTFSTDPGDFVADSPMSSNDDNESEKDEIDKEKCEETFNKTEKDQIAPLSRYKELKQKLQDIEQNGGELQKEIKYDENIFKQIPIAGDGDCLFTSVLTGYLMIDKDNWGFMLDRTRINLGNIGLNDGNTAIKFTNANIRSMVKNYVCRKIDDIQERDPSENNKLSETQIKDILHLPQNNYGEDNEIMVLSHMLNKKILVIKPYQGNHNYRLFNSDFSQDTGTDITKLLKEESEKAEPIILHNVGGENLQDSIEEHFNLLLTLEQYKKFEGIIQKMENLRKGVRDAATKEIIRMIPRDNISV